MNIEFLNENDLCGIPVRPRSKQPKLSEWQKRRAEHNNALEFAPDDNVGVVLGTASGGLVDIDLDSDLARQLAPHFLPPTGWVFGRESAPRSHYLYRVSGEPGPGRKLNHRSKVCGISSRWSNDGFSTINSRNG
jgi:hypothetical protein